jgi:hypothetical protein
VHNLTLLLHSMSRAPPTASRSTGQSLHPPYPFGFLFQRQHHHHHHKTFLLIVSCSTSVNKSREQTRKRLKDFEKRGESLVPITRPTEFPYQSWESYEEHFRKHGPRDVDV